MGYRDTHALGLTGSLLDSHMLMHSLTLQDSHPDSHTGSFTESLMLLDPHTKCRTQTRAHTV